MPRKKNWKRNQNLKRCSNCSSRLVKRSSLSGLCVQCNTSVNSPSASDEVQCGACVAVIVPVTKKYETVVSTNDAEKCDNIPPVPPTVHAVLPSVQEFTDNKKNKFLCSNTKQTSNDTNFEYSDMPPLIDRDDDTTLSDEEVELGYEEEDKYAEERQNFIKKTTTKPKIQEKLTGIDFNTPVAKNNATALSSNSFQKCDVKHELLCCENCCRDAVCGVIVTTRDGIGISFRKKLCNMRRKPQLMATYDLCTECYDMLLGLNQENGDDIPMNKYLWKTCWPSFLWFMFKTTTNFPFSEILWKMIPASLRIPWMRNFQLLSEEHVAATLTNPSPIFQDITSFVKELKTLKDSYTLVNFEKWCNHLHYCSVKCPWGCSEFADDVGYVAYHKLFYKVGRKLGMEFPFQESQIFVKGYNVEEQYVGIVDDFLFDGTSYFLQLVERPISPSIEFVDGLGPMVCTCKRHDKGSKLQYLHPPKNPVTNVLPVSKGDPVGHVAIAPRTVSTIKTSNKYSTTYQMQQCVSGFRGADTCDVVEVGRFDQNNTLSRMNAALAYYGRADIRSNVQQLVKSNVAADNYEESLHWYINSYLKLPEQEREDLLRSRLRTTRISLQDALKMTYYDATYHKLQLKALWRPVLAYCHPNSEASAGFTPLAMPTSPLFQINKHDYQLLYALLSMATTIPPLWECLVDSVIPDGQILWWHGFFLSYATTYVVNDYGTRARISKTVKNPYKMLGAKPANTIQTAYLLQCHHNYGWPNDATDRVHHPPNWSPQFQLNQFISVLETIQHVVTTNNVEDLETLVDPFTSILVIVPPTDKDYVRPPLTSEIHGISSTKSRYNFKLIYCAFFDTDRGFQGFVDTSVTAMNTSSQLWHITMNSPSYEIVNGMLEESLVLPNVVAIYIRTDLPDAVKVRHEYLSFIGSTSNFCCPNHDTLLVTKPLNAVDKCCKIIGQERCHRTAGYRCPYKFSPYELCNYMICRKCNEKEVVKKSNRQGLKRLLKSLRPVDEEEPQEKHVAEEHQRPRKYHKRLVNTGISSTAPTEDIQPRSLVPRSAPSSVMFLAEPTRTAVQLQHHELSFRDSVTLDPFSAQGIQHDPELNEAIRQSLLTAEHDDQERVPPQLEQWLKSNGLAVLKDFPYTPGNCLYDSVSYALGHGTKEAGFDLRLRCLHWNRRQVQERTDWGNMLVEALQLLSSDDGEDLHEAQSVEQYCDIMQDITKYATQLDVMFLCGYLQTPLAIYSATMRFHTSADGSQVPEPNLQHDDNFDCEPIKVYFKLNGAHYEPIVPVRNVHHNPNVVLPQSKLPDIAGKAKEATQSGCHQEAFHTSRITNVNPYEVHHTTFDFSDLPPLIDRNDDETNISEDGIELGFEEENEDSEESQAFVNQMKGENEHPQKQPCMAVKKTSEIGSSKLPTTMDTSSDVDAISHDESLRSIESNECGSIILAPFLDLLHKACPHSSGGSSEREGENSQLFWRPF